VNGDLAHIKKHPKGADGTKFLLLPICVDIDQDSSCDGVPSYTC